jgi:hypothetical protein
MEITRAPNFYFDPGWGKDSNSHRQVQHLMYEIIIPIHICTGTVVPIHICLEVWHINMSNHALNRDDGAYLPEEYMQLIGR